jgi:hypothetical protein
LIASVFFTDLVLDDFTLLFELEEEVSERQSFGIREEDYNQ